MKEIKLNKGYVAKVDDSDFEAISKFKWYITNDRKQLPYAQTGMNYKKIRMHRHLLNAPPQMDVDHINGDTLDNRRCNLRICTHAENVRNSKISKNNVSGVTGVAFHKKYKKWVAYIDCFGKKHLGASQDFNEAVRMRKEGEKKYFGEFVNRR